MLSALIQVYPTVLVPFGDNKRYDFVVEDNDGNFQRIQCKTGRYRNGVIKFATSSSTAHRKNGGHQSYHGQIEFFAVNCPDFAEVYLVPVGITGSRELCLRMDPPMKSDPRVKWAKDFLLYSPCK